MAGTIGMMSNWYCVQLWQVIVGMFLVFIGGNCCVMFAERRQRSALWLAVGVAVSTIGVLVILLPTVAGGG